MSKNGKGRKLVSLCVLGMVLFMLFLLVPFTSVVPVDAIFSSVTITDVTPTELHPGDTREVTVTVKNNGGRDARDINLAFQGTENVSLIGPTVVHINTLNSWCWKELEITVHVKEEATNGVYSIPVTCSWREYYFNSTLSRYVATEITGQQLGISFNVIGKGVINIGDVSTDPTDIRPGDEDVEIRVDIENSGEAAAKDVEAKLLCNDKFKPSWSGTDRSYMGRLNSGDSKEAIFHIDIAEGIEANTYGIPLRIRYKDTKGEEYEVMREINILVEPKPEFEVVSFRTEPADISAGDYVTLYVRIKNVGSEEAESISVRSTGEAEVPFDFDVKSDYVGNLKPDAEWTAVLRFDVDTDASLKTYQQGLEIRCIGDRELGDYNVYLFDMMIPISVSSSSTGGISVPGFEALFSLLALIFGFAIIGQRRTKKAHDKKG